MNQITEERELYMRIHRRLQTLQERESNLHGRTMPLIVRNHETLIFSREIKSAKDSIALITYLIFTIDNDFAINGLINHYLNVAVRNRFEGSWNIFFDLTEYFNVEIISDDLTYRPKEYKPPLEHIEIQMRSTIKNYEREGVIFSEFYWTEFLTRHFSDDDIFGNLLKRALQLGKTLKVKDIFEISVTNDHRPVKEERFIGRGYKDHGTMSDVEHSARRDASRTADIKPYKFDSLNQVVTWGPEDEPSD